MKRAASESLEQLEAEVVENIVRINKKNNRQEAKKNLKNEILHTYNEISVEVIFSFEQITNIYTVMEAYLRTATGKKKGLNNKIFMEIFDDLILQQKEEWFSVHIYDNDIMNQIWKINPVESINDMHDAIAMVYIYRHMFNCADKSFTVETLHFSNLREKTKHCVINILKSWGGIKNVDSLYEYVYIPEIIQVIHRDADFLYTVGVKSLSLNIDILRVAKEVFPVQIGKSNF